MRSFQRPTSPNGKTTRQTLQIIVAMIFFLAVVKLPLEMSLVSQSVHREQGIQDFYNPHLRPHSTVDQHIDARKSYHFFHRKTAPQQQQQRSLRATTPEESFSILDKSVSTEDINKDLSIEEREDAALADKVEEMVVR